MTSSSSTNLPRKVQDQSSFKTFEQLRIPRRNIETVHTNTKSAAVHIYISTSTKKKIWKNVGSLGRLVATSN
jgi:hypothetical protein